MTNTDTTTGSLAELRALLNVDDEQWQTIVAWLVAALLPGITRPALYLTGEQCSGKSVTATMLQHLVDPGAPLRPLPTTENAWIAMVDASRVVAFNDVDRLTDWQTNALCVALSGGTIVKRSLGTAEPVSTPPADRAFILTGTLHPEQIRADLAQRLVVVELPRLTEPRPQLDLWKAYEEARPRIFAALLDLVSAVLGKLTAVREKAARGDIPAGRMADWSLVVAALEEATA
ncbi:hypothetical protein RND61_30620 [Streptomyces sp. TRM76323]|uniref:Uncharacterized protein n=1 Tax=Streptomyces tamarix TaxID=3078565 RepID=A0ABU3QVK8_9ACTN|nr:hypothetical protein [Streptomyces tamarix]MDT9686392.1 hypothetical protein [Streptomyces tamarix]